MKPLNTKTTKATTTKRGEGTCAGNQEADKRSSLYMS